MAGSSDFSSEYILKYPKHGLEKSEPPSFDVHAFACVCVYSINLVTFVEIL